MLSGVRVGFLLLLCARALGATVSLVDCLPLEETLASGRNYASSLARESAIREALEGELGPLTYFTEGGQTMLFAMRLKSGSQAIVRVPKFAQHSEIWEKAAEAETAFFAELEKDAGLRPYLKHFARVLGTGKVGNLPYVITEPVLGKSLHKELSSVGNITRQTPITDVLDGARQLATGLKVLHATNRVHHDIKPDNILIERTRDGVVWRLVDLGTLTRIGTENPIGTPQYMHGERKRTGYKAAAVDDVYSFGLVLREMLVKTKRDTVLAPMDIFDDRAALMRYFEEGTKNDARRKKLEDLAEKCIRLQIADGKALLKELEAIQ